MSHRPCLRLAAVCITVCLVVSLTALASAQDPMEPKVQKACSTCHNLKRVCRNIGVKSREEWTKTVTTMVGKKPVLSGEDVPEAIRYLSSQPAGSPPFCQ